MGPSAVHWSGIRRSSSWRTTSRFTTRPSRRREPRRSIPLLLAFVDTAFSGALRGDFGPIARTNDGNALLAKLDFRLSPKHNASLKYNFTYSRQQNGTFDVDSWGRSANALEKDYSHAVNGSLTSLFSSSLSNEFRFQWAREARPRPYDGPTNPSTGRPFPDTDIDFVGQYRLGMPFFIPVADHDVRFQVLDNVSLVKGSHLFKLGAEWNRTATTQTFIGFGNGRMAFGSVQRVPELRRQRQRLRRVLRRLEQHHRRRAPPAPTITGPVVLYLQQAGVPPLSLEESGTQTITQHDLAALPPGQLEAEPQADAQLRASLGGADRAGLDHAQGRPVLRAVHRADRHQRPGDLHLPGRRHDSFRLRHVPAAIRIRLRLQGRRQAGPPGQRRSLLCANPGAQPGEQPEHRRLARTIDLPQQCAHRNPRRPPNYGELLATPAGPFDPDVFVFDKDFENPRTFTATVAIERELIPGLAASISYTHARTDHLTRFFNANDAVFGAPLAHRARRRRNGIGNLTVIQSTAKSRYNGVTAELRKTLSQHLQFQANYTLSYDKSDDDNERDPFTFRYARADSLQAEYGYSDRDQRHRFNAWLLAVLPGDIYLNNRVSAYSAQPVSEQCGANNQGTGVPVTSLGQTGRPSGSVRTATSSSGTPSARTTRISRGISGHRSRSISVPRAPSR